jgi:hypothetical protein
VLSHIGVLKQKAVAIVQYALQFLDIHFQAAKKIKKEWQV